MPGGQERDKFVPFFRIYLLNLNGLGRPSRDKFVPLCASARRAAPPSASIVPDGWRESELAAARNVLQGYEKAGEK